VSGTRRARLPGKAEQSGDAEVVRGGRRLRIGSSGAQVAAEAMTYDRARRTDCNTGCRNPGRFQSE